MIWSPHICLSWQAEATKMTAMLFWMMTHIPKNEEENNSQDDSLEAITLARSFAVGTCIAALTTVSPVPAVAPPVTTGGRLVVHGYVGRGERVAKGSGWCRSGWGGHHVRRTNCNASDIDHVWASICHYLPIFGAEFNLIVEHHCRFHPDLGSMGDQLKNKFNKLSCTKAPTGNSNIPPCIFDTKAIMSCIIENTE